MASVYITHADVEPLYDITMSADTIPTDTLTDALCEQAERLATMELLPHGYTLAQADANSTEGLKGVLIQIVEWLLDGWFKRMGSGGADTVSDPDGSLSYSTKKAMPRALRQSLLNLVKIKPTVRTIPLLADD